MTSLPARGRLGPNRIEQSVRRTGLGVRVLLILKALDDRVDDAALMAAVAADADRDAFAVVFRRYASKVKAHLVARGVAAGVADELTQEVMLLVWRKAALFDPTKGSLATWLFTISRNCLLNQVRSAGRRQIEIDVSDPADLPPTGEQQLIEAEGSRRLAQSVDGLPPEQRAILVGAYWKGQTLQECAAESGIPLGTAKTRVRLALVRLREAVGGGSGE